MTTAQPKIISTAEHANTCRLDFEPFKLNESDRLNSFRVLVDGEARAIFYPKSFRRGYTLKDSQGRPIRRAHHVKHYSYVQGEECDTRADFDSLIRTCLYESAIDTVEQQIETTGRLAREDAELKQRCENEAGLHRVKGFAQELFDMVAFLHTEADRVCALFDGPESDALAARLEQAADLHSRVHAAQAEGINAERENRQGYLMAGGRNV